MMLPTSISPSASPRSFRVPAQQIKPQPRLRSCSATPEVVGVLSHLGHALEEEIVLEGALHVSAVQAGSCLSRFSELQQLAEGRAPPPVSADPSITRAAAVCVATPQEPNEEVNLGRLVRQYLRHASGSTTNIGTSASSEQLVDTPRYLQGSNLLLEVGQDAWAQAQAAEATRRRRRAAYLSTLRRSKRTLGSLSSALASSWGSVSLASTDEAAYMGAEREGR